MLGRWAAGALVLAAGVSSACSGDRDASAQGRAASARRLVLEPVATLDDGSFPILAEPMGITVDRSGRLLIPDFSDRNIKIYDGSGRRTGTLGRAGRGPGEFTGPMYAGFYRDSLVEVDFVGPVHFFAPDLRYARSVRFRGRQDQVVLNARTVDDSLLLLLSPAGGGERAHLLSLVRSDGSSRSSFFNQFHFWGRDPILIQNTGVEADGRGGVIFATLIGGDSIFAFDYSGRLLAKAPADPVQPLPTTKSLLAAAGGKPRRPDGRWFEDQERSLLRIVALDSATAALQVTTYSAETGTDPIEGGTLLVVTLDGDRIRHLGRAEVSAGLMGRDAEGRALLLGYDGADMDRYILYRLTLQPVR